MEIKKVLAGLMRPELCNVMLLGEAGAGKTALVQAVMLIDKNSTYLFILYSSNNENKLPLQLIYLILISNPVIVRCS